MDIIYILTVLGVILISMTLHEVMHGFMAYWLGDDTAKLSGRLTLNPGKHIDPFMTLLLPLTIALINVTSGSRMPVFGGAKPVPFNPSKLKYGEWGAALVALAGPFTNFLFAFVSFAVLALFRPGADSALALIFTTSTLVNLGFFIFNMIPLPPLDGSRVLYALAPEFVRRGMEAVERHGILLVFAIVMILNPVIMGIMRWGTGACIQLFSNIFGIPS